MSQSVTHELSEWPVVVDGGTFRIAAEVLSDAANEFAFNLGKNSYYKPQKIPTGARIGWIYRAKQMSYGYGGYLDPDETVKDVYNEHDGVMYEFASCQCHAYANVDDDRSDMELYEQAVTGMSIQGEETFILWIEVEETEPDYLGDRMVRCGYLTQKGISDEGAYSTMSKRLQNGFGNIEQSVARKFPNYDIETESFANFGDNTSYVWVHTSNDCDDVTIIGHDRGKY